MCAQKGDVNAGRMVCRVAAQPATLCAECPSTAAHLEVELVTSSGQLLGRAAHFTLQPLLLGLGLRSVYLRRGLRRAEIGEPGTRALLLVYTYMSLTTSCWPLYP